jgi:hypothetical protein
MIGRKMEVTVTAFSRAKRNMNITACHAVKLGINHSPAMPEKE